MLNKRFLQSVVLVAGLMSVHANASLITNGSFENGANGSSLTFGGQQPSLTFGQLAGLPAGYSWGVFSGLPGWSHVSGYGPGIEVQHKGTLSADGGVNNNAADGNHYVELDTHFNTSTPGNSNAGMFQLISGLFVGQTYELSFWYRARDISVDKNNGLNVYWKPNGSVIDKLNADYTYDYNGSVDPAKNNHLNWVNYKQTVIATSSQMLVGFGGAGEALYGGDTAKVGGGSGKGALLDMVSLKQVSAPGTIALFGLAGLALFARRRKA
jgi:hypothetical protein